MPSYEMFADFYDSLTDNVVCMTITTQESAYTLIYSVW